VYVVQLAVGRILQETNVTSGPVVELYKK